MTLSKARTIAAHLAVASDGILRQEGREVLSPVQVRSILGSVARTHLAKLDRLAALETADGITADDGRSSDRIMGWARRLQASQGIAATVGEAARNRACPDLCGGCPAMRIPTAVLGHSRQIQSLSSPGPACALTQAIARLRRRSGILRKRSWRSFRVDLPERRPNMRRARELSEKAGAQIQPVRQ